MLYHIGGSIKIENKIIMKIVKLKVFEYTVFQKMLNICIYDIVSSLKKITLCTTHTSRLIQNTIQRTYRYI